MITPIFSVSLGLPATLARNIARNTAVLGLGVERGIMEACEWLLEESQKIVPIDTKFLHDSGFIHQEGAGIRTVGWVAYGAYYAIYVHEDPYARHAPGKEYKFLEKPARTGTRKMAAIVAMNVRGHAA